MHGSLPSSKNEFESRRPLLTRDVPLHVAGFDPCYLHASGTIDSIDLGRLAGKGKVGKQERRSRAASAAASSAEYLGGHLAR